MNENQIYTAHILICKRKLQQHLPRFWDPRKMVNGKKKRKIVKKSSEVIFWAGHCSPGLKEITITSSREQQDWASYQCSIRKHSGRGPPMTSQHPAESLDGGGLKGRGSYCFHFRPHR